MSQARIRKFFADPIREVADLDSCPQGVRAEVRAYLDALHSLIDTPERVAEALGAVMKELNCQQLVGVCSGSGVVEATAHALLVAQYPELRNSTLTMTDLSPEPNTVSQLAKINDSQVTYDARAVNALSLPSEYDRSAVVMVAAAHHLTCRQRIDFLNNAVNKHAAVCITEVTECTAGRVALMGFGTLQAAAIRPFISTNTGFCASDLAIIPAGVAAYGIDGALSQLNTPTSDEFADMIRAADPEQKFRWRIEYNEKEGLPGVRTLVVLGHLPLPSDTSSLLQHIAITPRTIIRANKESSVQLTSTQMGQIAWRSLLFTAGGVSLALAIYRNMDSSLLAKLIAGSIALTSMLMSFFAFDYLSNKAAKESNYAAQGVKPLIGPLSQFTVANKSYKKAEEPTNAALRAIAAAFSQ